MRLLEADVELDRRPQGSVPEELADRLVLTGMGLQEQVAGEVEEQVPALAQAA